MHRVNTCQYLHKKKINLNEKRSHAYQNNLYSKNKERRPTHHYESPEEDQEF